ncbi:MAG: HAD hydrolase-like protein, partial [Clostridia bacterium]
MKDFEVLLFDADNTLFDFNEAEKKALSNIFHEFSHPFSEVHLWTYREINRELWKGFEQGTVKPDTIKTERFAQLARVFSMDIDVEKTARDYLCFLGEEHQLMPNAYEVVTHLYGRIRIAILTNGLSSVQNNRLRKSEIGPYIPDIFISEEIGY